MRHIHAISAITCILLLGPTYAEAQIDTETSNSTQFTPSRPLVLGHGVGHFKVGPLLARDDFEDLKSWVVQIQQRSGFAPPQVVARDNVLDCLVPGRGCTVWFKKKLSTRCLIDLSKMVNLSLRRPWSDATITFCSIMP